MLANAHTKRPCRNNIGRIVSVVPTQGLVNESGTWLYPIHDEIPCLLADEAIQLTELSRT
jgi:uncharacterized protein YbaR (Trm112 family)